MIAAYKQLAHTKPPAMLVMRTMRVVVMISYSQIVDENKKPELCNVWCCREPAQIDDYP